MERGHELAVDRVHDAGRLRRQRALAGDQCELHAQELVELEPLRGGVLVPDVGRPVDVVVGATAVDQVVVGPQRDAEWIGEPAGLGALQARRHRPPQLPRVHLGLPRLRVHGHDGAGHVGVGLGVGEHVDDRVRHLALAPVALDLAEHRDLGPHLQLSLAPGLVEEDDLEQPGAVVDLRVDDGALAVAGAVTVAALHLTVDGGLVADGELVDLGPLGAVEVAARVVLEQIEHGLDAHLGEAGAQLVADGAAAR